MIVNIKKPEVRRTRWQDIQVGDVFSWGERVCWYVKTDVGYAGIGNTYGYLPTPSNLLECSTLVVAKQVDITP